MDLYQLFHHGKGCSEESPRKRRRNHRYDRLLKLHRCSNVETPWLEGWGATNDAKKSHVNR